MMPTVPSRAAESPAAVLRPWLLVLTTTAGVILAGCGGGGGGGGGTIPAGDGNNPDVPATTWRTTALRTLDLDGLTTPWVAAAPTPDGSVRVAYFEDAPDGPAPYRVTHLRLNDAAPDPEAVSYVDNCSGLALPAGTLEDAVLYQGGVPRTCGAELQSDLMLSLDGLGGWQEHTAAIGENPRNPYFFDGLAGTRVAAASDVAGRVHAVYQFYYEGCDAMNFRYPDLRYVHFDPVDPSVPSEETVEGNDYDGNNVQNTVGDHAVLVLDRDVPVALYEATLADGSHGLRAARRQSDGTWTAEWVETACEVGHISAAVAPDGTLGVAYHVTRTTDHRDDVHCLRYAELNGAVWTVQTLDESSLCGEFCALAFAGNGEVAVVYRAMETHTGYPREDLMLARRAGGNWEREVLASFGDLGHYNSAWFDTEGQLQVVTYSAAQSTIYLLEEMPADSQ